MKPYILKLLGYTLIELLIVLLIVGILFAIVYPSYQNYLLKSHRQDAILSLERAQILLEQCYTANQSYNKPCSILPPFPKPSLHAYYRITLSNLEDNTYTLTATALGMQAKDTECLSLSVTQANEELLTSCTH